MKQLYAASLLIGLLILTACTGNESTETKETTSENPIIGKWKLTKKASENNTAVSTDNQPTQVVLDLQENGFFIIYDTFVDPSWKKKGLPLIEQITKGQWKYENKVLTLNHQTSDTSYTETLNVTDINSEMLVTKGSNKKSTVYRTYGR